MQTSSASSLKVSIREFYWGLKKAHCFVQNESIVKSPFAHWFLSQFSHSLVRCALEGAVPSLQSLYLDSEELREECVMWVTSHSTFLNHGRKSFMWSTVDWCQSTNISWYLWESGTDSTSIFGNVFKVSKPNPELGWVLYVGPVFCSSYYWILVIKHLASWTLPRLVLIGTVTPLRTCFYCGKMSEATD